MWRPFRTSVRFVEMDFMTDIHSHILSGVDDGFQSEDRSFRALELLHGLGLRHALLTPHIYPELYPENSPLFIRDRFTALYPTLQGAGVSCWIAGEYMVYQGIEDEFSGENVRNHLLMPDGHILIEMSYAFESPNIKSFVFHLNALGYHPILAHPERYNYYSKKLLEISSIADIDTKLQLNILSLGGFYGHIAREKAEAMLEKGLYSYLGTDLHTLSQIEQLKSVMIGRKHVREIERLLQNNDTLWNSVR